MAHMLEVSARPWLEELGVGSLVAVGMEELQGMGERGFSWLWVMGVWQLGDYGRSLDLQRAKEGGFADVLPQWAEADVLGSPYAVQVPYRLLKSHAYDCSQMQALRTKLANVAVHGRCHWPASAGALDASASNGIRLMLDFVPNHTAIDCMQRSSCCLFDTADPLRRCVDAGESWTLHAGARQCALALCLAWAFASHKAMPRGL